MANQKPLAPSEPGQRAAPPPAEVVGCDSSRWTSVGAVILATLTALAGCARIWLVGDPEKRLDDVTLKYFAAAGVLLLLRNLKSFSFGNYKAEFQSLSQRLGTVESETKEASEEAKTAASMARLAGPLAPAAQASAREQFTAEVAPGHDPTDPWSRVFGGKAENGGRRLRAEVAEIKGREGWFRVHLLVENMDPGLPMDGLVQFFLHDTFPNSRPVVPVVDGVAELRLEAWGAFTVGVLADGGKTKLELDLSKERSFPLLFRSR